MDGLGKRLVTSAVFIAVALAAIFWAPEWIFVLVIEGFCLLGLNEFLTLAEKKGVMVNRPLSLSLAFFIPIAAPFSAEPFVLGAACLILLTVHFKPSLRHQSFLGTAVPIFGMVYVVLFFSHLIKMKELLHGASWVFYTILVVKGGDAGAYFVGKKWGKTKLIEHISPNKSVEGALGGFLASLVLSVLSKSYLADVALSHLVLLGIAVGIVSQLGDLVESLLKRDAGVKDSGDVPGLGGLLDVLDSLLLSVPLVYYYVVFLVPR